MATCTTAAAALVSSFLAPSRGVSSFSNFRSTWPLATFGSSHESVSATGGRRSLRAVASAATVGTAPVLKDSLQYRKLGDSDLLISEITLGTMTFGNQNTEKEAHEQLSYAFDNGINILDTAEMYPIPPKKELQGRTDLYISTWLKNQQRDKVIVATKVAGFSATPPLERKAGYPLRVNAAHVRESVDESLKRLGTDYIDLLQIHWPDRYVPLFGAGAYDLGQVREAVPFEEQLQALEEVIKQGKVRYIGVSNETSFGVLKFVEAAQRMGLPKIVSIQNSYSLLVRVRYETDLVETCAPHNCNVGLLAYSPLGGGSLTNKYADPNSAAAKAGRFNIFQNYMARYRESLCEAAVQEYAALARKVGLTPTQLALAFCRDQWFVTSSIIGATTMEHLKENLSAWALPRPLAKEVNEEIEQLFRKYRDPTIKSQA